MSSDGMAGEGWRGSWELACAQERLKGSEEEGGLGVAAWRAGRWGTDSAVGEADTAVPAGFRQASCAEVGAACGTVPL